MIDVASERLFPLSEAPGHVPAKSRGRRVGLSTVYRWASGGIRGVTLETVPVGGVRYTSEEALVRFYARLAGDAAPAGQGGPSRSSAARRRAIDAAGRELAKLGL